MAIETLRSLAWTGRPAPPLGVAPWNRKKQWFRWYVVHTILTAIWKYRTWRWVRRTGGKQAWF